MTALPIERVRGEHRIAAQPAPDYDVGDIIPFEAAASAAGMDRVATGRLGTHLGAPVWRLEAPGGGTIMISGEDGAVLSPLDRPGAIAAAMADYSGGGAPMAVTLLSDPPTEYSRPGPIWQVVFDDLDRTTLYVSPDTGEVEARRSRTWRTFDLAWRLHVMDWDDGADFNHSLLQAFAGAGTLFGASGLTLIWLRLRQQRQLHRHRRLDRVS